MTGAAVGQIVKISAVDADGKPTEWVPVDLVASGDDAWEKIADVALTADVFNYELANFGVYRKVKVLMHRATYVSGLNKNVWFRIRDAGISASGIVAACYLTNSYGYIAWEVNAEIGATFASINTTITNNRVSLTAINKSVDVICPANPSEYALYMDFTDTSVIQEGDTVAVYGVRR